MSVFLLVILCALTAQAKDLGFKGYAFPIEESNLLDQIELKINQKNEELGGFQQRYLEELKNQVTNPHRVNGISKAAKERYRKFDPTTELEEDIRTDKEILYSKGTKINPLDHMRFDEPLVFINGEDKQQVEFAHNYHRKNQKSKIVLISGKPGVIEGEKQEYYHFFDQCGAYSSRFGISHVPSVVTQDGQEKLLTIWEVKLP